MKKILLIGILFLSGCQGYSWQEIKARHIKKAESYSFNSDCDYDTSFRHLQWRFKQIEEKLDRIERNAKNVH